MTAPICEIVPPFVLLQVARTGSPAARTAALRTLSLSAASRAQRALSDVLVSTGVVAPPELLPPGTGAEQVTVYDVRHGSDADLPGKRVRGLGEPPVADVAVNEALDGADTTYRFYLDVYGRNSVDGAGLPLVSSVHYGRGYDNAFWNGGQMVYGDGSGQVLQVGSLTRDLDVIAHELTHGVTQHTAALAYHGQSGALNESMSDVFGSLARQHALGQTADEADWLIGEGILGSALHGVALRSMKAPGTAFDGDPQPATMADYRDLPDDDDPAHDNGGVHINSGISNHAFYLAATAIGGHAWEAPGRIWYDALTTRLSADSDFRAAADAFVAAAGALYGPDGGETAAVRSAWQQVGVLHD